MGQQGYRFCAQTRRAGAGMRLEAPFVGREAELAALRRALEAAALSLGTATRRQRLRERETSIAPMRRREA
ncbi:MAG TPA: hypothetical protein VI542_19315 [Candidatus Tectomicrobia bacterium]